jgi:hypothetical protein
MRSLKPYILHFTIVIVSFLLSCIILAFSRNFIKFNFPLFEEILFGSILAALFTLSFTFYLKKRGALKDSIQTLCYVNILALMFSVLVLPYSLLNIDRSRSFYVLSWVNQGRVSIENGQIILNVESTESVDRSGVYLRVVEQQQRGLISRSNQTYEITSMGKLALVIANMLAQTFSLENWETNKK